MNKTELIAENKLLKENLDLAKQLKELYTIIRCAECGNILVLNSGQYARRYKEGSGFYCSAGHRNVFTGK